MTPASKHKAGGKSVFVSSSLGDWHLHIHKWSLKEKNPNLHHKSLFWSFQVPFPFQQIAHDQVDCFQLQRKRFLLNFATQGFSLLGCLPHAFSILQALFAADTHVMLLWLGSKRKSMLNSRRKFKYQTSDNMESWKADDRQSSRKKEDAIARKSEEKKYIRAKC